MCDELGPKNDYMTLYVEEAGSTFLCQLDGTGCSDEEQQYIEQMKAKGLNEHIEEYETLLTSSPDPKDISPAATLANKQKKILKQMIQSAPKQEL